MISEFYNGVLWKLNRGKIICMLKILNVSQTNNFSFKDYELYEQIGKGGFASVHRAICKANGIPVAIKMVRSMIQYYFKFLKLPQNS
jgi:serine/threonine protein kinase